MTYSWETVNDEIKDLVILLQKEIKEMMEGNMIGFYLHGSLAMGCFNPNRSDIDLLVVTEDSLSVDTKRNLAKLLLKESNSPYPVEISILHIDSLKNWQHPCPFEFHYSEFWRTRYEEDLVGTTKYLNEDIPADADLTAHITILHERGICLEGEQIEEVFPQVSELDYIDAIMDDFQGCIENISGDPIYSCLNMIRVYWYLKEGVISSKLEAGEWGLVSLPEKLQATVRKAIDGYINEGNSSNFTMDELQQLRDYVKEQVNKLVNKEI
ncbi:aminoglycoside adenylyltransferase domain-containing protein [Ornithinibacillus sp. 179-J 7C1 HS]|uniref:aminoglycoside adenylyltransferase domain-containing protein n=1 Tax=Ornithinibacillus sp. 179-J 7C1 HS TaxID=3142384 RepID=UPI0039A14291